MFPIILWTHIATGTIGLVLGPIAMYSSKRKGLHTQTGTVYFYCMSVVCAAALVLSVMHWQQSWWLSVVGVFSFSLAARGYFSAKKRESREWLQQHISGMLGSYIAMTTALLVVNARNIPGNEHVPGIVFWILPTIIGSPLVRRTRARFAPATR